MKLQLSKWTWGVVIALQAFLPGLASAVVRSGADLISPSARTACLDALVSKGHRQVGAYNLEKLINELNRVRYVLSAKAGSESNLPNSGLVVLNPLRNPKDGSLSWSPILLHKGLLALGYADEDYKISSTLCWSSYQFRYSPVAPTDLQVFLQAPHFQFLQKQQRITHLQKPELMRFAASIKYDLLVANSKMALMSAEAAHSGLSPAEVEAAILNMTISFYSNANVTEILTSKTEDGKVIYHVPEELFLINERGDFNSLLLQSLIEKIQEQKAVKINKQASIYSYQDLTSEKTRTQCVQSVLDLGLDRIGDLDLRDLKNNLSSVQVTIQEKTARGSGGLRKSALNYPGTKKVTINKPKESELNYRWELILLHESLGALGYQDENYELSTSICWTAYKVLARKRNRGEPEIYVQKNIADLFRNLQLTHKPRLYPMYAWTQGSGGKLSLQRGGGATSTGGGGDIFAAVVKFNILRVNNTVETLRRYVPQIASEDVTFTEMEQAILRMRIELFNDNPEVHEIQQTLDKDGNIIYWAPKSLKLRNSYGYLQPIEISLFFAILNRQQELKKGRP